MGEQTKCDKLWKAINIDMKIEAISMRSFITSVALYGWRHGGTVEILEKVGSLGTEML